MLKHKLFADTGNGNPPPKDDPTKKPNDEPAPIDQTPVVP
jgi:hypothetical protein